MSSDTENIRKNVPQRQKGMDLFSLDKRRLRGDIIEAFKISKDLQGLNVFVYCTELRTRANFVGSEA